MAKHYKIVNNSGTNTGEWLAIYTQPRWEKKVNRLLVEKGIETYCPLNTVYRKWSDRMKKVEEPLFKSYVFVCINEKQQLEVRMTPGVLNFVYWLGKPAKIKPEEIETIRRFLDEHDHVEAVAIADLQPGDKVIIDSGLMMNAEATVIESGNKYAEVLIDSIGFKLRAKVEKTKLIPARRLKS